MKKRFAILLFAACLMTLLLAGTAQASTVASGKIGKLKWTVSDRETLTISGSGKLTGYKDFPWNKSGWKHYINRVEIKSGVTEIGEHAFDGQRDLFSVSVAGSVKKIGDYAFRNCGSMNNITLNKGLETIGAHAFDGCFALVGITIPSTVTDIGLRAFVGCQFLHDIQVSSANKTYTDVDGVLYSKDKTVLHFYPTKLDDAFTIPSTVKTVKAYAFTGNNYLCKVTVPASVRSISTRAFTGCGNLREIKVNSKNTKYSSANGILFNKDKTTLIHYPVYRQAAYYALPKTVTKIGDYAFYNCGIAYIRETNETLLRVLYVREGVTAIGKYAFKGCDIRQICLPKSLKTVGTKAFSGCSDLKIKYCGTKTQWKQIEKNGNSFSGIGLTCSYKDAKPSAAPKLKAKHDSYGGNVTLSWNAVSGATHYQVFRSKSKNGTYSKVGVTADCRFNCADEIGTTFYYKVKAVSIKGSAGSYSNSVSGRRTCCAPFIAISMTDDAGHPIIYIGDYNGNALGKLIVYRSTSKTGTYKKIGEAGSETDMYGNIIYTDTTVKRGKTYWYKVKATAANGSPNTSATCEPISFKAD